MTRIIRPDSPARARSSLAASVAAALTDLDAVTEPLDIRDRLAYAVLALHELERSTERTADAWEHRGYWVKADQFRREWGWAGSGAKGILAPLLQEDLAAAKSAARNLLSRLGPPPIAGTRSARVDRWKGAFVRLKADPRAGRRP